MPASRFGGKCGNQHFPAILRLCAPQLPFLVLLPIILEFEIVLQSIESMLVLSERPEQNFSDVYDYCLEGSRRTGGAEGLGSHVYDVRG